MKTLDWRVQTITPSEVSVYFLRQFWREHLNKRVEVFPIDQLQDMINNFTKKGLLFNSCLHCTYSEIAIGAVGVIFQVLDLKCEGISFISWALDIIPLNLV